MSTCKSIRKFIDRTIWAHWSAFIYSPVALNGFAFVVNLVATFCLVTKLWIAPMQEHSQVSIYLTMTFVMFVHLLGVFTANFILILAPQLVLTIVGLVLSACLGLYCPLVTLALSLVVTTVVCSYAAYKYQSQYVDEDDVEDLV